VANSTSLSLGEKTNYAPLEGEKAPQLVEKEGAKRVPAKDD
jgi:hypothetical protein